MNPICLRLTLIPKKRLFTPHSISLPAGEILSFFSLFSKTSLSASGTELSDMATSLRIPNGINGSESTSGMTLTVLGCGKSLPILSLLHQHELIIIRHARHRHPLRNTLLSDLNILRPLPSLPRLRHRNTYHRDPSPTYAIQLRRLRAPPRVC